MKCTSRLTTLTNCLSNIVIWITNLGDHSLSVLYCTLKLRRAAGLEGNAKIRQIAIYSLMQTDLNLIACAKTREPSGAIDTIRALQFQIRITLQLIRAHTAWRLK